MRSDTVKKGLERSPHRSLLKATGNFKDADIDKPMIAIASSHVDIVPGHAHLHEVAEVVKEAVREAGGVPFVFNAIGVCDGIAMGHNGMKFSLPSRELIADCIETMLQAHRFDGMVCIPNCDKIVPGMLMGAARVNIPTIFVSGGPMEAGMTKDGCKVDLISTFAAVAERNVGKIDDARLNEIESNSCPTCGSCSGLFTANSMNCLCEALGIALPGNGTILASSADRVELYRQAGRQIIELVKNGVCPRDLLTLEAFDNAMVLDMAIGGSTNTLLHILAIANDAGVPYDMSRINELSQKTPNLAKLSPSAGKNGKMYHIEDLQAAGGITTVLGELMRGTEGLLNTACPTVTGKMLGENIAECDIRVKGESIQTVGVASKSEQGGMEPIDSQAVRKAALKSRGEDAVETHRGPRLLDVINQNAFDPYDCLRTAENAYSPEGGLFVLYGNLATDGAVVKTAGVDPEMMVHTGPAVIFESQEDACEGILAGKIKAGDVVVIRNEGPRGGPGMQEMLAPTSYLKGAGLADKCALITDGRFSGGTAGACIGHISPEAAAGGTIGLLKDGDIIEIDIPARTLNVRISDEELATRRSTYQPMKRELTGWLKRYASMVSSADKGGVLDV